MQKITKYAGKEGQTCLLFPSIQAAMDCKAFATSPGRGDGTLRDDQVSIRVFNAGLDIHTVFFPAASMGVLHGFWLNTGVGSSSRRAEYCLKHLDQLHEVAAGEPSPTRVEESAHVLLKERIAGLLERAPVGPHRARKVSPDDVYLYQTGMSAIYWVHKYLLGHRHSSSVLFGFAFHSTIHVLEDYGPGVQFFGLGTDSDLTQLEKYLSAQAREGKKIQAVWAEFPSNPLLVTPDLARLKRLTDEHGAILVVDDTIGSFCNVDILGAADIVVSSLTKSFSGYADVMAASAVLNPSSPRYGELKQVFDQLYHNDFYVGDAEALENNSRNYLQRSATLNRNAQRLVEYLQQQVQDPASPVQQVFYPTVSDSLAAYQAFMRPATEEFTPGYGCMFSVEFESLDTTIAFYDNLNVHQGPHLGAHLTLALPYCMGVYGNDLGWAERYNVRPTQIRISVGLEDTEALLEVFGYAVRAARTAAGIVD